MGVSLQDTYRYHLSVVERKNLGPYGPRFLVLEAINAAVKPAAKIKQPNPKSFGYRAIAKTSITVRMRTISCPHISAMTTASTYKGR